MSTANLMKVAFAPVNDINVYISTVKRIPLLSAERELELVNEYKQNHKTAAAHEIIVSHLSYVVNIASRFVGYDLPKADLIQAGNIGLLNALEKFDPARDVRFGAFAIHWITAAIHDFVRDNWNIVKLSTGKARKKLFYRLRSYRKDIDVAFKESEIEQISKDLNVSPQSVREMEIRMYGQMVPFNNDGIDDEDFYGAPETFLYNQKDDPAYQVEWERDEQFKIEQLRSALTGLNDRQREIIQRRHIDNNGTTLAELAQQFNVSIERVRQIEKDAINKLRMAVTNF